MPGQQIDRPFRFKTPLGDDALLLESFQGVERVSAPFHFSLRLLSNHANIDMKALLSKPAVLSIRLSEAKERHIHGHISRFRLLEFGADGMVAYEAEMVPWLWFLTLFSDCRIFQNKSVPEIVERVFRDRGFSDFDLRLRGSFPRREYCVQYCETDFNFVSRLLEEEGIFYFFEQSQERHSLVLANSQFAFAPCPNKNKVCYLASSGGVQSEDTVFSLEQDLNIHTGTASITDYDFEKPTTSLFTTLAGQLRGEDYFYPGRYKTKDDGDRYVRIRIEEKEIQLLTIRGAGNCMGFECGYRFTLTDHFRNDANQDYSLIALHHYGRNTSYRSGEVDPFEYSNRFDATPHSVPYRPPRITRKPVIVGTQTAVVVGKSGEEIWTDDYGRIKVHFHWDREGAADENASCWIRVGQSWAGKQWGAITIPRIGQEVIVSFLEGDPDRPIVTGCVYNADQTPPYKLPDEQTKSAMKSRSSVGGEGFNEIRFEDKKGEEQVFVHGEKDIDIRIKNDHREWIGDDRHLIVTRDKLEKVNRDTHITSARDRIEKIGRDHHLSINGKEAISITGSHSLKIAGDVIEEFGGNHSTQVTQNYYVKGLQIVVEAATGISLKVGSNFVNVDPAGVTIQGTIVLINSGGAPLTGIPGSLVSPLSPTKPAEAANADPGQAGAARGSSNTPANMQPETIAPTLADRPRRSAATNAPTHEPDPEKKHWIEIELIGEDGQPIAGEPYRIVLPDGTTIADGTLDNHGRARVDGIDPGTCQVTFPNRDRRVWRRA